MAASLALLACLTSACSLLFATDKEQCKSDDECRARGAGFESSRCSLESVCVAASDPDGSTPPTDGALPPTDGGDAAADPFACATLPAANPDNTKQLDLSIKYTDFSSGAPPVGIAVRLCASADPTCANPRTTIDGSGPADGGADAGTGFVLPKEGGLVAAKVEYGFEGFLEVRSTAYAPTFRYTSPPLRNPKNEFEQLMLRPSEISFLADTALAKPNAYDSVGHGLIFVFAQDCNRKPLAGVRFTTTGTDPLLVPFYIINSAPEIGADKKTDALGRGGFINMPSGFHTFTAEWADTGKRIGSTRVLVRNGAATTVAVLPSP